MIIKIGDLALPESIESVSEQIFRVRDTKTAASGKNIIRAPVLKWESTFDMGDAAMDLDYQASFYDLCLAHISTPATVTIVNPYSGEEIEVEMRCVELPPPSLLERNRRIWSGASAKWEEV